MTLSDHSLSKLLDALQAGQVSEKIRTSLEWVLQQLIEAEAEATALIGGPASRAVVRSCGRCRVQRR